MFPMCPYMMQGMNMNSDMMSQQQMSYSDEKDESEDEDILRGSHHTLPIVIFPEILTCWNTT